MEWKRNSATTAACLKRLRRGQPAADVRDARERPHADVGRKHRARDAGRLRGHRRAKQHIMRQNGVRRFDYSGYHFGLVEPWPVGWGYSDDVYIDLVGDQYYLFNVRHPGVQIAVNVVP